MAIPRILSGWRAEPDIGGNIAAWQTTPAVAAQLRDMPDSLHPTLANALKDLGYHRLFSHQDEAYRLASEGQNVAVVTGTASGKTLCYNLPVLDAGIKDLNARALYLFPTKALAQDQQEALTRLVLKLGAEGSSLLPQVYDGDTPTSSRSAIRKARIVISNPDMLHAGILPHHTLWADFFRGLRFVILDEMHSYRGVFGSHITNVLRRLSRIAAFYGSQPCFILTSATIANPGDLAEKLVEAPVSVIDQDGAAHGRRHFLIYNPPITNPDIGLRKSALLESVRLASEMVDHGVQTIIFGRTRRTIEKLLTYLRQNTAGDPNWIRGYRSGYLRSERRAIEQGLRQGKVRAVVATNALELGIDIGSLDASILVGYPGTIAAARQQAGRAGRQTGDSVSIMVASADALDQFLTRHPEYFFDRTPEMALIQPDNLLILLQHLRCAAFELSFKTGDSFGRVPPDMVTQFLTILEQQGVLHQANDRFYWMADQYPASSISLRSASTDTILLQAETEEGLITIGQVDRGSADWMVHPQAIYLHEGQSFLVEDLNLEDKVARLRPETPDYYTEPLRDVKVECQAVLNEARSQGCGKRYGELLVTSQVTGYRRVRWFTYEQLGTGTVDLPPSRLVTTGYWLSLDDETVESLRERLLWANDPNDYGPRWPQIRQRVRERDQFKCQVCGALEMGKAHHVHHKVPFRTFTSIEAANQMDNLMTLCPPCHHRVEQAVKMRSGLSGLAYVLYHLAPFFLMCDTHDLGSHADPQSPMGDGKPTVVLYDNVPAGIGLSERLFEMHSELLQRGYETVQACQCTDGCPSCVGPAGENGAGGKQETLAIFEALLGIPPASRPQLPADS